MPPDVFLMLASSGLALVGSLMFFVSDEREPPADPPEPRRLPACYPAYPSRRVRLTPPPLPHPSPWCAVTFTKSSVMSLRPSGDEWEVTLDVVPISDSPAMQVQRGDATGAVHDLRWHGKAGLVKSVRRRWRQKPGQA